MKQPIQQNNASHVAHTQRLRRQAYEAEQKRFIRQLVTPEGAILNLKIGSAGQRIGAFAIDVAIQWAVVIATLLLLSFMIGYFDPAARDVIMSLWLVAFFFFRNFYYIFFEMGRRAATPGKRLLSLRVASRDGGRLTANAVLARNFIREIEFGLPFQFLMMGDDGGVSSAMKLFGLLWSGVFLFFPLFNKDRMRVGDLIAGTWVVEQPKTALLGDISSSGRSIQITGNFAFTPEQVDAYGIHELHVLEDVLRQSQPQIRHEVAARIRTKIGWIPNPGESDIAFLEAYYAALRQRLEQRMLFGQKKTDKFDK